MKKLLFLFSLLNSAFAIGQITFQKSYGGYLNEGYFSVQQTFDGGYYLYGSSNSFHIGGPGYDAYLIKTDYKGDTIWTKVFDGDLGSEFRPFDITPDSGVILALSVYDSLNVSKAALIKLDSQGNVIWSKLYEAQQSSFVPNAVKSSSDGGYIVTGEGNIGLGQYRNIVFMKTDSTGSGSLLTYGGPDMDMGFDVVETQGGFAIYGVTNLQFNPYARCLVRLSTNGILLSSKHYGGNGLSTYMARNFQQTIDGGYIFNTNGGSGILLSKTDSMGDIQWSALYSFNSGGLYAQNVRQTLEGEFIITGVKQEQNIGHRAFLIKADSSGVVQWARAYGDTINSEGYDVIQTSDGGFIMTGTIFNFDSTFTNNVYLIKTDSLGYSDCFTTTFSFNTSITSGGTNYPDTLLTSFLPLATSSGNFIPSHGGIETTLCISVNLPEAIIFDNLKISLSPNPFHTSTSINISEKSEGEIKNIELKIYNSMGAFIRTEKILNLNSYILHRKDLNDGMYFYEVLNSNHEQICTGKFIVE